MLWDHTFHCTRSQHPNPSSLLHIFPKKTRVKEYDLECSQTQNLRLRRPEIVPDLPKGGVDIQDVPLYWIFPSGRCESYTMLELRSLPGDEFLSSDADADEAYLEMAKQFRFDVLGVVAGNEPDKALAEFREDMGTLFDERWKSLTSRRPDKESSP